MIQNVLRSLGGVGLYGVISICLFFTVFGVALLWTLTRKQSLMRAMSALPLQPEEGADATLASDSHE